MADADPALGTVTRDAPCARGGPAILMTYPYSLGTPGGGTVGCMQIARHLQQAGARVVVATVTTRALDRGLFHAPPPPRELDGRAQAAELQAAGIEVVHVTPHASHPYFDGLSMRRAVAALLARRRFAAVLGWHHEHAFLARLARQAGAVRGLFASGWYAHLHDIGWDVRRPKRWLHRRVERALLRWAVRDIDVVFAISEFTRREFAATLRVEPQRIRVARWGVDPAFAAVERQGPPDRISRFVFFGSPAVRKGGFDTLRALAAVAARGQRDWKIELVWTRRDELLREARALRIADRVLVLDPMDQPSLARVLMRAQVAVLPSTFESFGLACAEAQASGIPVIAYDTGGVAEIVADGVTGWLVPNGRVDLLGDAIGAAIADPARTFRMGLAAQERLRRDSWACTAAAVLEGIAAHAPVGRESAETAARAAAAPR